MKNKLILIIMLVSMVTMLLASVFFITYQWFDFRSRLVNDLSTQAAMIADNSTAAISFNDAKDAKGVLNSLRVKPAIEIACLYLNDNSILAAYFRDNAQFNIIPNPEKPGHYFDDGKLLLFHTIMMAGQPIGTVYIKSDLSELTTFLNHSMLALTLMTIFITVTALIAASKLQGAVSRPLIHLMETIRQISAEKDFSVRAHKSTQDEIGLLTGNFNEMLSEIELRDTKVRVSEEKYRSIFENLQDVYFEVKLDGTILEVSPSIISLSSYTPSEIIGTNISDLYARPEERQVLLAALNSHRQVLDHEIEYQDKNGTLIPCSINAKLRYDSTLKEEKICGTLRDITERKQAEKELARLASAIENTAEQIIITSTEGIIEYVNPAFEKITGYDRPEILGTNFKTLHNHASTSQSFQNMWDTITHGKIWSGQTKNRKKDGTFIEEEATISPIQDSTGNILGYVFIKRDVTEKHQLEAQLRQAQKLEAIGTLAGGIAHDFNNILSGIYGFTELALMDSLDDSAQKSHLKHVINGASRARELVKQILTFSRQREVKPQPVQLLHVIKEGLKLLSATLPATIQIKQNIKSSNVVLADPTQIHQLLMNLCTNASHAMQDNGGVLSVELADTDLDEDFVAKHPDISAGQYVSLTISDTGHGIDNKTIEKIFDPFYTTKREGEGTGLGLSVVHGIVKKYGGLITVDSKMEEGTSFHIFLPALAEGRNVPEEPQISLPTGREKILFVDDAQTVAELAKLLLESLGYEVTSETEPQKALELFKNEPQNFDLVITDQIMPHISGDALARKFLEIRPELPIILTSGHKDDWDDDEIRRIGFKNFISKPFRREEIAMIIRKTLDNKT